jgi:hypothetical protein
VALNQRRIATAAALLAAAAFAPAHAGEVDMYDGQWRYNLTPYGWFPSIKGEFRFSAPGGNPSVETDPSSYLKDLQFAGMLWGEARKGHFTIFTDIVYADVAGLKSTVRELRGPGGAASIPINVDVDVGVKSLVWTAGGGYTVVRDKSFTLDVLAGVRYGGIESTLGANASGVYGNYGVSRGTTQKVDLWDGIVGVQGRLTLDADGRWYVPYEVDIGAGSNNLTWNGILGVGYRFDWGSLVVAYRNLSYRMDGDGLVQSMDLSGPAIGATFRW